MEMSKEEFKGGNNIAIKIPKFKIQRDGSLLQGSDKVTVVRLHF
ncbi:hypothetical protein SAMN04487944_11577 [Gracilibacillus ureilyticus]|uniref:Uncharacterized protein n=1 Tax=Gracilibacillus ureilyticus TaxID=531814 RepID=A0A1H9TZ59_9BACI|nr:hypothetical protein [Gracilibacillus ureilyticus]SES02406.1 hypothetical protein SAMN04487944_11577 [Gracilibacillus ureilyticus]